MRFGIRSFLSVRATTLVLGLAALSTWPGCEKKQPPAPPPPAVSVAQPVRRSVTDYLELTGTTQASNTVQVVARVAGYLEKVFFKDGQLVKKGQPLFLIQQNTYIDTLRQSEGQVLQQRALLEYAGKEWVRYSNLLEQNATSRETVDNWRYQRDTARANLQIAEAQRDLARLNLSYTEVVAPFDGRIDRKLQDVGSLVGAGANTPLAELNQIDPVYVYFNISDADLSRLTTEARWKPGSATATGWPMFIGVLDEKGYPHKGQVDFASISLTPTTGTLLLRGIFSNGDGKILPGLYARIVVPLKTGPALLLPQEALGDDQRGAYVLVVGANNVVQRVGIKTGPIIDRMRVVEEGLTGQEWVVVNGIQKAIPGRLVTPERQGLSGSNPPAPKTSRPTK
jgi:RND family efflux transporter MFP subunit